MAVVRQRATEAKARLPQAHQKRTPFTAGGCAMMRVQARRTNTHSTASAAKKSRDSSLIATVTR